MTPEDVGAVVDARLRAMVEAGHLEERGKSNGRTRYKLTEAGAKALDAEAESSDLAELEPA